MVEGNRDETTAEDCFAVHMILRWRRSTVQSYTIKIKDVNKKMDIDTKVNIKGILVKYSSAAAMVGYNDTL